MARSRTKSIKPILTGIIIFLLTIGLSLFMITDAFSPKSLNAAAMVGDDDVSLSNFKSRFDSTLYSYNNENGTRVTGPEAYNQGFATQILNNMITAAAWRIDAEDLGVGVASKVIVDELSQYQVFKGDFSGKFDESKLDSYLNQQRQTRDQFEAALTADLALEQTQSAISAGIQAPMAFASQRFNFLTEQRKATVLTLGIDAVEKLETPDDETIKTFIAENQANYIAPEYRAFTILRLELTDFYPDIEISEAEIKELYDYKIYNKELGTPERRSVTLLNVTNETLASDAIARLNEGESAEQVTAALGLVEPTFYDSVERDAIIDSAAADAAFAATPDTFTAIEGALSWYVVSPTAVTPALAPSFEDVRQELANEAKTDAAESLLYDVSAGIEDAIGAGASLEEASKEVAISLTEAGFNPPKSAAQTVGASLASIGLISRLGDTVDGQTLSGVASITGVSIDENILTQVFTNDLDFDTDFFETSKGGYAILRVDEILDSKPREFEDVKESAQKAYMALQYDTILDELTRDLTARVRGGETLAQISESLEDGASLQDVTILRSSRNDALGTTVLAQLFNARKGDVVQGDGPAGLTRNIAVLGEIIPNADGLVGGYADAMRAQVNEALEQDLQQAYSAAIMRENPVQVFDDKIRAIIGVTE